MISSEKDALSLPPLFSLSLKYGQQHRTCTLLQFGPIFYFQDRLGCSPTSTWYRLTKIFASLPFFYHQKIQVQVPAS